MKANLQLQRLDNLPTEILRLICEYTLPQGLVFTFLQRQQPWSQALSWRLCAARPGHTPYPVYCPKPIKRKTCGFSDPCLLHQYAKEMQTALLYVNKVIGTEAHAALYAGNTFRVYINAQAHYTSSLDSPLIFGPFGHPHRTHLIRDFRRVRITLDIDDVDIYGIIRLRARVQHFVNTIKEHAEDETRKSLLKGLHVRLLLDGHHLQYNRPCKHIRCHSWQRLDEGNRLIGRHMFALEPLADLHPLNEIKIVGCPEWFTRCLLMRMRNEGGPLTKLEWPMKTERRRQGEKKYKKVESSTRRCWQPVYDWMTFAERDGVALLDEATKFFS